MRAALTNHESNQARARGGGQEVVRPRVLHLLTSFYVGGTEQQAVALLNRLDQERFDVRLAVLQHEGPLYEQLVGRFPDVPEFRLTSFYNSNAVRQFNRLRDLLLRERIDLLHAHDFYSGMLGVVVARMAGVPIIASQRHLRLSDRRVHDWGQRLINRLAHRLLVNSEAIRTQVLQVKSAAPKKIVVIKNGVFDDESLASQNGHSHRPEVRAEMRAELGRELGLDENAQLIGMVARLEEVKGHRYLVEAAAQVVRRQPQAHFLFVGEGTLRPEIEAQVARLGVASHVHLLGQRKNAARLATAFDLAVLSSLHEGMPNTVIEAMGAGVPVVATAVGGTMEVITDGETGLLAPPANSAALARSICWMMEHDDDRRKIAAHGCQSVLTRFGMSRMVAEVEGLYDEMLKAKGRLPKSSHLGWSRLSTFISSLLRIADS